MEHMVGAMRNAVSIDLSATAVRYQTVHATWLNRVDAEARFLDTLRPDLVLTDVAYLPLAAAARVGIPAMVLEVEAGTALAGAAAVVVAAAACASVAAGFAMTARAGAACASVAAAATGDCGCAGCALAEAALA